MTQRALCIGINDYPGTDSDLAGCVNDADDWAAALGERGFTVSMLKDSAATREAMLSAMREHVEGARRGDVVVVTYSGHGTWVPDQDRDEKDMRDEALCPHDLMTSGAIIDDELFDLFSERERGVRVVLISDSCHSGTVCRFAPRLGDRPGQVRFLPPETFLRNEEQVALARRASAAASMSRSRQSALLLAGCRDTEYSYDASFSSRPNGAFTYVALRTLQELNRTATYREWMARIRQQLPSASYPQTPQLDGSSTQRGWQVLA